MGVLIFENLLVGGTLLALQKAYDTGYPLLCIPQKPNILFKKERAEWERLSFLLSLSGQLPLAGNLASIRIDEDERQIKCFTQNLRMVTLTYEVAHVMDVQGVEGIPPPATTTTPQYLVFDWINVKRGTNHPYDYIEDEDSDFVKKVIFYPSERIMGKRTTRKDACAISIMTDKQLRSLDYSESYTFLKVREMMENAGLKGSRNGTQAFNGKPAYLSLKIEIARRDVTPMHRDTYEDTPTIKFHNSLDKRTPLRYNIYLESILGSDDGRGKVRGSQNPSRQAQG